MRYTEAEILDILKYSGFENPTSVFKSWNDRKSNTLPTDNEDINTFLYSFPIIINEEEVATITLVSLYGTSQSHIDNLMQKYFGTDIFNKSFMTFSHDTYLHCYLTVHKEFTLTDICKGFVGDVFVGKDSKNNEFIFKVSAGWPDDEEDSYLYHTYVDDNSSYRFDNGVHLTIPKIEQGWNLSDKIKENVTKRIRDYKIESLDVK